MINTPAVRTHIMLIRNFAERESKARYKRSALGWLWSLIKPLVTVVIYSLVFGVIYRADPPVTANGRAETFALYLFTGLVIWNLFTEVVTGSMQWLKGVSDLRKKIYFPTETVILGGAVSTIFQSTLEALVLVAIMIGFGNVSVTFLFLPLAMLLVAILGLGVGFVVSIFNARYRDTEYMVGILLSVTFFLIPIVYTPDLVPEHAYGLPIRQMTELNPLGAIVAVSRDAVYFLEVPTLSRLMTAFGWATATFVLGLIYFRRRSMQISEEP